MSNKIYDILKYIQRIALPAVIVFLGALGAAINWDCKIVVAVVSAVDVFLGSLLQISYNNYTKEEKEKNN